MRDSAFRHHSKFMLKYALLAFTTCSLFGQVATGSDPFKAIADGLAAGRRLRIEQDAARAQQNAANAQSAATGAHSDRLTIGPDNTPFVFPKPLLRGVPSIEVHSSCDSPVALPFSCSTLEQAMELRLRLAGIPIRKGGASLWISVTAMSVNTSGRSLGWTAQTTITVVDYVSSVRDPALKDIAIVWTDTSLNLSTDIGDKVRAASEALMDHFLNVFLEQNPRSLDASK